MMMLGLVRVLSLPVSNWRKGRRWQSLFNNMLNLLYSG